MAHRATLPPPLAAARCSAEHGAPLYDIRGAAHARHDRHHRHADSGADAPGRREPRPGAGDETSAHARHHGQVVGPVEYRAGDGPSARIPEGPITVDLTDTDATLSWEAEDTRETAAIPTSEFRRYLSHGAITLDD